MNEEGTKEEVVKDRGDNEVSPTEELRESENAEELSVPGSQNPVSDIKHEERPNTE